MIRKAASVSVTRRHDGNWDLVGESGSFLYPLRLDFHTLKKLSLKLIAEIARAEAEEAERREKQPC